MTSITKKDFSDSIVTNVGLSTHDAKEIVNAFFEEIRLALENGNNVKLSGFGNFSLNDKTSRPGRNPKTGKDVTIGARRVVSFKGGDKLKRRVTQHNKG